MLNLSVAEAPKTLLEFGSDIESEGSEADPHLATVELPDELNDFSTENLTV